MATITKVSPQPCTIKRTYRGQEYIIKFNGGKWCVEINRVTRNVVHLEYESRSQAEEAVKSYLDAIMGDDDD